jgi:hypothetical protein
VFAAFLACEPVAAVADWHQVGLCFASRCRCWKTSRRSAGCSDRQFRPCPRRCCPCWRLHPLRYWCCRQIHRARLCADRCRYSRRTLLRRRLRCRYSDCKSHRRDSRPCYLCRCWYCCRAPRSWTDRSGHCDRRHASPLRSCRYMDSPKLRQYESKLCYPILRIRWRRPHLPMLPSHNRDTSHNRNTPLVPTTGNTKDSRNIRSQTRSSIQKWWCR